MTLPTIRALALPALSMFAACGDNREADVKTLVQLQEQFLSWRLGMFLHFNMSTFTGAEYTAPNGDPALFNPTDFDADRGRPQRRRLARHTSF